MRPRAVAVLLFVAASAAAAQDDAPPPKWAGEASAGVIVTSGNSESSTLNGKGEVVYNSESGLWRNTLTASAIKTEQTDAVTGDDVRTAERYAVGNKTDFNFTERDYAFLALELDKDLVGPVRERTSETAGYGRKILTGPEHLLEAELGAGARQTEDQGTQEKHNDLIGRARVAYKWNFTETSYFGETLKVESGDSSTTTESVTELRISLVGRLFALGSYTVRSNSDVPPGTEKTDTITALSLGWTFGK